MNKINIDGKKYLSNLMKAYCRVVGLMQDWEISALGMCGPDRLWSGLA